MLIVEKLLLKTIEECICECNNKLKYLNENSDENDECKISYINEIILPDMENLKDIVKSGKYPSYENRYSLSFACAFKEWNWDMRHPSKLYLLLLKINDLYKEI